MHVESKSKSSRKVEVERRNIKEAKQKQQRRSGGSKRKGKKKEHRNIGEEAEEGMDRGRA
jgi:hypothetical protein